MGKLFACLVHLISFAIQEPEEGAGCVRGNTDVLIYAMELSADVWHVQPCSIWAGSACYEELGAGGELQTGSPGEHPSNCLCGAVPMPSADEQHCLSSSLKVIPSRR